MTRSSRLPASMAASMAALMGVLLALPLPALAQDSGAAKIGSPEWTKLHTESPSHFSQPMQMAPVTGGQMQMQQRPSTQNYAVPTQNAMQGQNPTPPHQAQNITNSTQAVNGKNCTPQDHRARLC